MYYSNLISEDYLMHYGVKGMKWGVRHDPERSARRARVKTAKGQLKTARKKFNKSYNSAYAYSYRHPISQYVKGSKSNIESNRRWQQATKDAHAVASAKRNYKKVAGKGANARDTAAQVAQIVGTSVAVGAATAAVASYITIPGFRSAVNGAMKTAVKNTSANAKRGFDYMTKTRYNKGIQLMSPGAASRAEFKRSTYRSMNKTARKVGSAYNKAVNGSKTIGETARNAGSKAKNAASTAKAHADVTGYNAYSDAKTAAKKATDKARSAGTKAKNAASTAKAHADVTGYNAYSDAKTAASRAAKRASTDAKIVREMGRSTAKSAANNVRTDARYARQGVSAARDSATEAAKNTYYKTGEKVLRKAEKGVRGVSNKAAQYKNRNAARLRSNNRNSRYTKSR